MADAVLDKITRNREKVEATVEAMQKGFKDVLRKVIADGDMKEQIAREMDQARNGNGGVNRFLRGKTNSRYADLEPDSAMQPLDDYDRE